MLSLKWVVPNVLAVSPMPSKEDLKFIASTFRCVLVLAEKDELLYDINELRRMGPRVFCRPIPDGSHEIIDCLHRVEATKRLDWKDIEATVVSVDDLEAKLLVLKANLVRRNLEPVEEEELVYSIMVKHGLSEKQVAEGW